MATDSYSRYDAAIAQAGIDYSHNPWTVTAGHQCELDLLNTLVGIAVDEGLEQNSGTFAKAFDAWAAVELRRAGFPHDDVWPRDTRPRVLTRELWQLSQTLTKGHASASASLRSHLKEWLATHDRARRIAPTEAKVLGGVYRKQADVLIADWAAGVELMISTKSMLGSYGKNLRNRFEEGFGDAINLRQRFPLGAFGYMFVIDTKVPAPDFAFLVSMLTKLEDNAGYDAVCLLLVNLDERRVVDRSGNLVVPESLGQSRFFDRLVGRVVDRTPSNRHPEVRQRRGLVVSFDDESVDG